MKTCACNAARNAGVFACLVALHLSVAHAKGEADTEEALLGALGPPAGDFVVSGGGGLIFNVPYGIIAARVGLGGGFLLGAEYDLIGLLGHAAELRLAWGGEVEEHFAMGGALSTGIGSLRLINVAGVELAGLDLGNDWIADAELVFTWIRPERASITASVGTQVTLAALEFQSYTESGYELDFALRGVTASVQGEWQTGPDSRFFLRLEGLLPLDTDIVPLGFLPTATGGMAWSLP